MSFASPNRDTFQLNPTLIVVGTGLSNIVQVVPPRCMVGGFFKLNAVGGTLAIVNAGQSFTLGYLVGQTEVVPLGGPANFYLCASGATATIAMLFGISAGFSGQP